MKRILVAALIGLAAGPLALGQTPSQEKIINSLAVLPFLNVGHDQKTEYLSDEITRKLINSLSKLPNLKVVPYASVLRYKGLEQVEPGLGKGKALDLQTVRNDLGVQAVLYGRVHQLGESLSISAELVDARDNTHIWGDHHVRQLSDFLPVQEQMAHDISKKLRPGSTIDWKVNRHNKKAKRRVHKFSPK